MNTNIKSLWARIILQSYKNVDRIVESLDRTIDCVAMQGFNSRTGYATTEQVIEKIIDLTYRKQGLINFKVIAREVMKCMKKDYIKLLNLKFNKNRKFHEIASEMNISLRTVFRYYDKALHQFSCMLKLLGYTDEMLEKEYSSEPFVERIKAKIDEEYRDNDYAIASRNNMKIRRVLDRINIVYSNGVSINN